MSLLLQALQKAAKSREGDADSVPAATTDLALEPASPGPRQRQEASTPAPTSAQAATIMQASGASAFDPLEYAREHYMLTFIGFAIVFAIAYGTYVYVQINHPFRRAPAAPAIAAAPRAPAPSAPVGSPGAKISGMPEGAVTSARSPADAAATAATAATAAVAPAVNAAADASPARHGASPQPTPPPPAAVDAPSASDSANPAPAPSGNARKSRATTPAIAPASREDKSVAQAVGAGDTIETVVIPSSSAAREGAKDISKNIVKDVPVHQGGAPAPAINPTLIQAYEALQGGERARARQLYDQVLQAEPRNLDALLGLGAIALNDGRLDEASRRYQQVLELDPRNSYAQAGLISIVGGADPTASESHLKQLIARDPSAFLYFSLGNLYAQQSQWPAAQQAYFQALQMQPDNPDYAFNLAIGLEHLGQDRLALEYYRKALELSFKKGHANFDQSLVIQRVGQLSTRVEQ